MTQSQKPTRHQSGIVVRTKETSYSKCEGVYHNDPVSKADKTSIRDSSTYERNLLFEMRGGLSQWPSLKSRQDINRGQVVFYQNVPWVSSTVHMTSEQSGAHTSAGFLVIRQFVTRATGANPAFRGGGGGAHLTATTIIDVTQICHLSSWDEKEMRSYTCVEPARVFRVLWAGNTTETLQFSVCDECKNREFKVSRIIHASTCITWPWTQYLDVKCTE